jgi:predicted RND superfamily exporter protein
VLGIFTDIVGVFLIAIAPIPAMERFALFCGMWCVWLIPTGVVLISLLLASLPAPKNIAALVSHGDAKGVHKLFQNLLHGIAKLTYGSRARFTTVALVVLGAFAALGAFKIQTGNPVEGSNLLWPSSEYNTAVSQINQNFPGVNTLELVLEAKDPKNPSRVARQAETVVAMQQLQSLIEKGEHPPRASLSFADYLMEGNRLYAGGNPKWLPIDPDNAATNAAASAVLMGSSPKAYSHIVDFEQQHSTVSLWYPDNKQETVDGALATALAAVEKVNPDHDAFTIRLGTGTIALQQAMNRVVDRYHWLIFGLLNLVIFLGTSFAYRSPMAGLILLFPVNLSNFVMMASMWIMGIGMDINTVLVACVGVGVGIDYGIYLLSRICEEYQAKPGGWGAANTTALTTTGKAIMFTASIMVVGIAPWYFLSGLKFMADMGLLLVLIMLINMVLALVVLPLLIWLIKPSFVSSKDLLVLGESAEIAALAAEAKKQKEAALLNQSPPRSVRGGSTDAPAVAGG